MTAAPNKEAAKPKRSSNRTIDYKCTVCGRDVGRDNLVVKRAVFATMGENWRQLKLVTTGWLCTVVQADGSPSCLDSDDAWTQPKLGGISINEVRAAAAQEESRDG